MDPAVLEASVRRFFERFVEAFATFDGGRIAERYTVPYLAFHANGKSDVFNSGDEIAAYFQRVVDAYHEKGVRSCSFKNLEVVRVGSQSAFATVTWKLHAEDGSVLLAWRESYNLWLDRGEWWVFASVDHVA